MVHVQRRQGKEEQERQVVVRVIVETLFSQLFGRAVHEAAAGQADPLTRSVMQWVADMQRNVLRRWKPIVASGMRCALRPRDERTGQFEQCAEPAIGACGLCRQPVCLRHSMIGQQADIVCTACLSDYVRMLRERDGGFRDHRTVYGQSAPPTVAPDEAVLRKNHLRTLGLKEPTDWAEIHAAFRKKAARMHPDRAKPGRRAEAEAKFKALNEAYQWLRPRYERAA